ncbi:NAD-dependent protein deacetylase sirtuin-1 [Microcaecilia unicolor]|uniref:protein acetyllysine N-acetyltransferase n=1 Tax=Microcaecilia unicolor TaxID=1415580 RepID=A0A6P7Y790_9AMPH|nr:NAD-dependent protein deacetylase sirtuin-1 [Microcaecilia unicolor]
MADGENLVPQSGSRLSAMPEGGEPASKRSRIISGEAGPLARWCNETERGSEAIGEPVLSAAQQGEEVQATAALVRTDNGAGLQGLPVEEQQRRRRPQQQQQLMLVLLREEEGKQHQAQEEEVEEVVNGAGAVQAIGYRDNILLSDDILANGFHSCDSDEDDRTSHASSSDWTPRPRIGPYTFVQQHLLMGTDPRTILKDLLPETIPPPELDDMTLWQIVINILSEPPKRKKCKDINTIEDAVKLLQVCKKIIVLTGAGVSVSCGIPDFRSRDGIYARLAVDFPDLPDPQAMFDIEYFRKDPRPFFKFAKEIYPGQFQPSLCHKFIAMLDKEGKLLRNYTQNIDTLEQVAGIQRIIQCHGSFATASCLNCKYKVDCEAVREDIFNQVVPRCPRCPAAEPLTIMKPEIVFFGENLPEQFHRAMKYDKDEVDLLIVIGSSLKVRPVALIPSSIPHEVPQILINREPLPHLHFDVELLGDCDVIINELCQRLGGEYTKLCYNLVKLTEITEKPPRTHKEVELQPIELPPTPLNISENSNSLDRTTILDSSTAVQLPENTVGNSENFDHVLESNGRCVTEKSQELSIHTITESFEGDTKQLVKTECLKENGSSNGENKERREKKLDVETLRKCWISKFAKEQISKRLDGTQYLFLTPNRYIFHGAEVYSDSEDDIISSSSCGSNSESESCHSPSLEEPVEEESETEEFYNGVEDDADIPDGEDETGCGVNGMGRETINELTDKTLGIDSTSLQL